ncbi:5-formyltetrahydrofolate cyclo-ligase [Sphingomonas sp. CJ99]
MTASKRELRAVMRDRRDGFVAAGPPQVAAPHWLIDMIRRDRLVAAYIAIGSEAGCEQLIHAAAEHQARIALPHVTSRAAPLRFLAWQPGEPLVDGPMGLKQPDEGAEELAPDLILTPLLAFDAALHRLGQGAGHYDRAFARYPNARRIGVAWSVQQVPAVPTDPWDVPLHAVVTEAGALRHQEDSDAG